MSNNLKKQYDNFFDMFAKIHDNGNKFSNSVFYDVLLKNDLENKKILDLGCGDGQDMEYYKYRYGENIFGTDSSEELIKIATSKGLNVRLGDFEKIPFEDKTFDVVLSKYALQTIESFEYMYKEVSRVLKPGGKFIFLAVHPMRQFFEKKTEKKNYFNQTLVVSKIFQNKIEVTEPTHTLESYISKEFLKEFDIKSFTEKDDFYSAERIGEQTYPTYFIISAIKR